MRIVAVSVVYFRPKASVIRSVIVLKFTLSTFYSPAGKQRKQL